MGFSEHLKDNIVVNHLISLIISTSLQSVCGKRKFVQYLLPCTSHRNHYFVLTYICIFSIVIVNC